MGPNRSSDPQYFLSFSVRVKSSFDKLKAQKTLHAATSLNQQHLLGINQPQMCASTWLPRKPGSHPLLK